MAVRLRDGTVIYASEAQIEYVAKQIMGEAMNEGLVAPSWSDSGEVPVGEVTYTLDYTSLECDQSTPAFIEWPKLTDPNAKPSLPSLSKVAGESYRGLGWCDE